MTPLHHALCVGTLGQEQIVDMLMMQRDGVLPS